MVGAIDVVLQRVEGGATVHGLVGKVVFGVGVVKLIVAKQFAKVGRGRIGGEEVELGGRVRDYGPVLLCLHVERVVIGDGEGGLGLRHDHLGRDSALVLRLGNREWITHSI